MASIPPATLPSNLPSRDLSKETPGRAELGPYPISLRTDTCLRPHLGSTAAATGSIGGQGMWPGLVADPDADSGPAVSLVTSQGSPAWSGWSCVMNQGPWLVKTPQKAQPWHPSICTWSGFLAITSEGREDYECTGQSREALQSTQ